MTFSTDRDLVIFEPRIFADLLWPGQVLAAGAEASLAGTTFTADDAAFSADQLSPGMVLCLQRPTGEPGAVLEIVSVDSPTTLTVSALRADPAAAAVAPRVTGDEFDWHIVSFAAQAQAVALEMLNQFGLSPADPSSPWVAADIIHPESLRTLSAYGVLATVLTGAATRGDNQDGTWAKATHYRSLFDRLLPKVRLSLDNNADGRPDAVRCMSAPRLRRD